LDSLHIIPDYLLFSYIEDFDNSCLNVFHSLSDSELSIETFNFYTSVAAVFSSKIEGEEIEMDSYIKHKRFGVKFLPDYTKKIDDLYDAYSFAQKGTLNISSIRDVHSLLTKHILVKENQGKFRKGLMYVVNSEGKIEYVAASPDKVEEQMLKFGEDLQVLLNANLSFEEVFFFASMIHLVFLKIHPFEEGNGRTARLLEKWFIASKLGKKAWFMSTEKYYYHKREEYYRNIRAIGL
jgi:Fic family protein